MARQYVILMDISGTGRSTVNQTSTHALGAKFIDGNDLHPRNNIVKVATSQPLNDEDRQSWPTRTTDVILSLEQKDELSVLACSALKKRYRGRLHEGNAKLRFLWLTGDYDCVLQRMRQHKGYFMPKALLRSRPATLETPDASESDILAVDITSDVASTIAHLLTLPHS